MLHPEATGIRLDKRPLSAGTMLEMSELGLSEAAPAKSAEPPYTKRLADILEGFLEGWLAQAQREHVCCIIWNGGITWHMVGFSTERWHRQKSPAQPQSEGLQHQHLHPHSPLCWIWLWSFSLNYFGSVIYDKIIGRPYSLLSQMSTYLYTNTKAVFCRRSVRKGLVHFSSHTKNWVSPSLSWPLAKLNTFPGLPKSLVPVWPAKDQNTVRGAATCTSTILPCPRQG